MISLTTLGLIIFAVLVLPIVAYLTLGKINNDLVDTIFEIDREASYKDTGWGPLLVGHLLWYCTVASTLTTRTFTEVAESLGFLVMIYITVHITLDTAATLYRRYTTQDND